MFLNRGGSVRSKTPSHRGGGSHKGSKRQSADAANPSLLGFRSAADLDAVSLLSNTASMVNIAIPATAAQHQPSSSSSNASAVSLHHSAGEDRDQLMEMTHYGSRSPRVTGKVLNGNSSNVLSIDEVASFQQVC